MDVDGWIRESHHLVTSQGTRWRIHILLPGTNQPTLQCTVPPAASLQPLILYSILHKSGNRQTCRSVWGKWSGNWRKYRWVWDSWKGRQRKNRKDVKVKGGVRIWKDCRGWLEVGKMGKMRSIVLGLIKDVGETGYSWGKLLLKWSWKTYCILIHVPNQILPSSLPFQEAKFEDMWNRPWNLDFTKRPILSEAFYFLFKAVIQLSTQASSHGWSKNADFHIILVL